MTSVITDNCIKCGTCVDVCPMSAITESEEQMVVNPDVCIDCGVCISECPQGAIQTDTEADQKWIDFNKEKTQD
jgi:ferredoxin